MRARELALESDRPVIFDPNLRLHRWRSRADAAACANACVPGALLVRLNEAEATVMTGEEDPERAALALVKAGARMAVVTLGMDGAILRGEVRADVPGVPVSVLSTIGAGDVAHGRPARAAHDHRLLPAGGRGLAARGGRGVGRRVPAVGSA